MKPHFSSKKSVSERLAFMGKKRMMFRSFTLVELLIVIAIIAILAGLLLPALAKARDKAKQITCNSNIRNMNLWNQNYINDFDGWVTPYAILGVRWYDLYPRIGYVNNTILVRGALKKEVNHIVLKLRCPSNNKTIEGVYTSHPSDWWNYMPSSDTYGLNGNQGYTESTQTPLDVQLVKTSRVKHASKRITFADKAEGLGSLLMIIDGVNRPINDRHDKATPIAFLDGHSEAKDPYKVNPYGVTLGVSDGNNNTIIPTQASTWVKETSTEIRYMWGPKSSSTGDYRYDYP